MISKEKRVPLKKGVLFVAIVPQGVLVRYPFFWVQSDSSLIKSSIWCREKLSPKSITIPQGFARFKPLFGTQQLDYFKGDIKGSEWLIPVVSDTTIVPLTYCDWAIVCLWSLMLMVASCLVEHNFYGVSWFWYDNIFWEVVIICQKRYGLETSPNVGQSKVILK